MAELADQIEEHVQRALLGLQSADVRANAHWLPGLPPLIEGVERHERDAAAELLERVTADRPLLADAFNAGRDPGRLVQVRLGRSDPHNGRRTVALLEFATGPPIVYKPRAVTMEAGFFRLARWVARIDADLAPRAPVTLERDHYGYCRQVSPLPCASTADVRRFYLRLGALTKLLAAVRATDCHPANFVAAGDWPVLVDAETLLHPRLDATPTEPLLGTEILPSIVTTGAGQRIAYGGFDAPVPGGSARPILNGQPQPLAAYRSSFDCGVDLMATMLTGTSVEVDRPDGPLQLVSSFRSRLVLRPTEVYARLLGHRLSARSLAAPDGGWPVVDRLLRRFEDASLTPAQWDAVRAVETAALGRADIPYFLLEPKSGSVLAGDGALVAAGAFSRIERPLPDPG